MSLEPMFPNYDRISFMGKKALSSVWLIPTKTDAKNLRQIIKDLARKYNAESFTPHLTIYGGVQMELKGIEEVVKQSVQGVKPFVVETNRLDHSDIWQKTLFIHIKPNDTLSEIYRRLEAQLHAGYVLNPHISLIYQDRMTREDKLAEMERIHIPDSLTIDRIAITYAENPISIQKQVESWKTPFIYNL